MSKNVWKLMSKYDKDMKENITFSAIIRDKFKYLLTSIFQICGTQPFEYNQITEYMFIELIDEIIIFNKLSNDVSTCLKLFNCSQERFILYGDIIPTLEK